ncbi:hypothetical protein C4564_01845 [Candidatus Microgenomates bacterium]|nr:MAG: hypothetical protein C4564_01845 [Candidatus Microgenomates bacterium]
MSAQATPVPLQENVLTMLCFSESGASIVAGLVSPGLFDNEIYRRVAELAINYIARYKKPPKTHIADLLEKEMSGDKRRAKSYRQVLKDLYYVERSGYNEEYILQSLRAFIRQQKLKGGVIDAAKYLQTGEVAKAEEVILKAVSEHDTVFEKGLSLADAKSVISSSYDEEMFPSGVETLDKLHIGPGRKTLFLFMAPTNRGKTWALINCAKSCVLHHLRVLHITLEMSEKKILKRYMQALFSVGKHATDDSDRVKIKPFEFSKDKYGQYLGHSRVHAKLRPAFGTRAGSRFLRKKAKKFSRLKLLVKEFPTAQLTIPELSAYLDVLERQYKFIPDVLILDYADLMKLDTQMLRLDTGRVYRELRGLGVERNFAVVTASQSNRSSERARLITTEHSAEDYSKMQTADYVITYNQTHFEKQLGLARLYGSKVRDEVSGKIILISQAYEVGQFCIDSAIIQDYDDYLTQVEEEFRQEKKKREDDVSI